MKASAAGPGTVRQLAERGCVGYGAARYTASRLVSAGALARVSEQRPALLALPQYAMASDAGPAYAAQVLQRAFGPQTGDAPGLGFADI